MKIHDKGIIYPFYLMLHPIIGSEGIKWDGKGSYSVSIFMALMAFVTSVLQRQATGFIFNPNRLDKINVLNIFLVTALIVALWITSNRALCTLMDGEGKTSQIIIGSCYALLPYLLMTLLSVVLSHFLTYDMGVFLTCVQIAGYIWSGLVLFQAMRIIHQFTFKQTIWNLLLTVVGMMIIAFIMLLIYSLFQQLYIFFFTIFNEIMFRL
ncbi:MAG: hypothetical protein KBG64_03450 [Clostridia bacterium]|nr:hypothetical protein [Clostridia bacterium]